MKSWTRPDPVPEASSSRRPPEPKLVAAECAKRIDSLCAWLQLAPLHKSAGIFTPLNPTRGDRHPGSFVIYGQGHAKQGGWTDFATGDSGDAMDLCGYVKTGNPRDRKTSFEIALRFVGWAGAGAFDASRPEQAKAKAQLEKEEKDARDKAAAELAGNRKSAFDGWRNDKPLAPGDPVWTYLKQSRGVDLAHLAARRAVPNSLRWRANAIDKETDARFDCMTALITGPDDKPWAVHRTFLKDGRKAALKNPRRIWPTDFWGGAIRIAKGKSGLSPAKALAAGCDDDVLAITEGVEDALTVALACPEWRVWAAGNLMGMGLVEIPACVRAIILIKDNDDLAGRDPKAIDQARRAWDRTQMGAAQQAKKLGAALYVARPKNGAKDFNDVLQAFLAEMNGESA
jgi:hypothetical protein